MFFMFTFNSYAVLATLCIAGGVFILRTSHWQSERKTSEGALRAEALARRRKEVLVSLRILGGAATAIGVAGLVRALAP